MPVVVGTKIDSGNFWHSEDLQQVETGLEFAAREEHFRVRSIKDWQLALAEIETHDKDRWFVDQRLGLLGWPRLVGILRRQLLLLQHA